MYSSRVRQMLLNPVNNPPGIHFNGIGCYEVKQPCKTNPKKFTINRVKFYICVEGTTVRDARTEVFGDPIAMAAGSWCVQEIIGLEPSDMIHLFTPENIALSLDAFEGNQPASGCLAAAMAVANALSDFQSES
jgi:NifU-like protein involved in Fe-S cluster formation